MLCATKVKGGMRNATLMAIAPTASIGLVAGTTPGLDPQFSQIFSRSTSSGKFLEVNRNLVAALARARPLGVHP
jgi:ribonucleoside-diphosphate reductase alpha chain